MQVCSSSRRGAQLIDMDAEGRGTKGRKVEGKMGDEVFTRQTQHPPSTLVVVVDDMV